MLFRIHVISDCRGSEIVSPLSDTFHDTVVTDFSEIADAALKIHHLAKSVACLASFYFYVDPKLFSFKRDASGGLDVTCTNRKFCFLL